MSALKYLYGMDILYRKYNFSTCLHIQKTYELSIPIGRPVGNSTAYILNQWGVLQPVGAVGELCVGGDGVARGYLEAVLI